MNQKLETHYTVRRTFYSYVQELNTIRQIEREPIHAWGNRIENTLSSIMAAMPSITADWCAENKDGAIDIMVHIGKQMIVQGIIRKKLGRP